MLLGGCEDAVRVGTPVEIAVGGEGNGHFHVRGRVDALQRLEDALALAARRQAQLVLVSGDGGIGKSALLAAFAGRVDPTSVVTASGNALETSLEFGLVDQLLGRRESWRDPYAAGQGLLQHLGRLPADSPSLLVVDNAHLGDAPSQAALNFMVRRLRTDPVMLVVCTRPEGAVRLPTGLVRDTENEATRVELGGLSARDVQDLAVARGTGDLSHRAAQRLRAHTDGSPLHLCALLDEIPLADLQALDRPLPAPRSFALLVLRDVAAVSPAARRLVSAAAVLGERVHTRQLLAVAGLDPGLAPAVLDELHRRGLLLLPPGATHVQFRHPLVRAAIYEDLGPGARIDLHQRAADPLSGLLDVTDRLRHRMAATLAPDDALGAELEHDAIQQEQHRHVTGAAHGWLAAARFSTAPSDANRRLLHGVSLLLDAGDVAAALSHADTVSGLPESGTRLYVQARLAWLTGHADEALRLGQQAWSRQAKLGSGDLEPGQGDQLAAMLAQIEMLREHGAQAAKWAATALDGDIDPAQAPQTRAIRANALLTAGQVKAALACFADLPVDPRDVEVRRHPELAVRGVDRTVLGDLVAGENDLLVAGSLAHGDFSPYRLTPRGTLALARFRRGDWAGAEVMAEEVVALAEDMEQPWLAGYLHAIAALVPAGRGNWDIAQRHVDTAHTVAQTLEPASAAYADDAAIFLAMCRGDPAAVVRHATRLRGHPTTTPHEPGLITWPVHLVAALVQLGHLDEAEVELERVEDLAVRREHPSRIAAAARLRGQLADAHRDRRIARAKLDGAVSLGNDHVDADERAMAHLAYATFLRRRGERRAAIEQALARQRYGELGATPFLKSVDEVLAACGAPTGSVHDRKDPLTPQERAVARLVASGRTNQQAADELVVSVKTISFHLQNVYAKLDVHSRTRLTGLLGETSTT